jgi:cytochrome P450
VCVCVCREQEEQQEIARSKGSSGDEPLTWADTRRMRVTSRAIQETMRVASILSFTFREAVEDVEYQGETSRHGPSLSARAPAPPFHVGLELPVPVPVVRCG